LREGVPATNLKGNLVLKPDYLSGEVVGECFVTFPEKVDYEKFPVFVGG
jgi:hypothetical protein